jgi:molybdopterin-biosynthesis enzyme MoeA-like protein
VDGTLVYVLPGVPAELMAIFTESIVPELTDAFEPSAWAEGALRVHVDDEAEVAEPLRRVKARHPEIYLKSLAQPFPAASTEGLRIIATAQAADARSAQSAVDSALADLRDVLQAAGFSIGVP